MGNGPSIPHLRDEAAGSRRERRAAKINNHIRMLLWEWWHAAEEARGVYVELTSGERKLLERTDYKKATLRPSVKKVLLFADNGEDLNVFIDWVVDAAPKKEDGGRDPGAAHAGRHGRVRVEARAPGDGGQGVAFAPRLKKCAQDPRMYAYHSDQFMRSSSSLAQVPLCMCAYHSDHQYMSTFSNSVPLYRTE